MMSSFVDSYTGRVPLSMPTPVPPSTPRTDLDLADALTKVPTAAQAKAKATATDFEGMFINSMFSQMTSGLKGDGPFGDTPATGVWRSMLTEQYSKNFAKAGGVGISDQVFRELIMQQAKSTAKGTG
ncbi:MAG: flagellar assembly peptidoglycan hydrolase FlgJ [Bradyrhizobium sp.]|uniref:flagellar assembly peptidoglycan hydrolase FlgJ n=1 Tax=Bradyrhizobium sp. TaxID=376 RepID=UPI003C7B7BF0